jgi:hypothetical protein
MPCGSFLDDVTIGSVMGGVPVERIGLRRLIAELELD